MRVLDDGEFFGGRTGTANDGAQQVLRAFRSAARLAVSKI
ncbi:hypothetical protein PT974_08306 [Cladobotryum mycophilum]|uniref:Uncharacterized protein n=1 Tax=Cladobotryum mycophilum TaxID=491253 RepID=A0ABR0SD18_9HYPO